MLYYLFDFLDKQYDFPGAGVFQYLSFRAAVAAAISLLISMAFGKRIIEFLRRNQIGEDIRDLGLDGQMQKKGTPTMGGIIILAAIIIPTLLVAKLHNIYIIIMLLSTIWLGTLGFIDDYIKVFRKNKAGLHGKFKIFGQLGLGMIVGFTMYFNENIVIREKIDYSQHLTETDMFNQNCKKEAADFFKTDEVKSLKTTIPFVKGNEFDYGVLTSWMGDAAGKWGRFSRAPCHARPFSQKAVEGAGLGWARALQGVAGAPRAVPCGALPRRARPRTPPLLAQIVVAWW